MKSWKGAMATRRLSSRAEATPFLPPGRLRVQFRPDRPSSHHRAGAHGAVCGELGASRGGSPRSAERPGPCTLGPVSGLCSGCLPARRWRSVWVTVPLCQSAQAPEQRQLVVRAVQKVGDRRTGGLGPCSFLLPQGMCLTLRACVAAPGLESKGGGGCPGCTHGN